MICFILGTLCTDEHTNTLWGKSQKQCKQDSLYPNKKQDIGRKSEIIVHRQRNFYMSILCAFLKLTNCKRTLKINATVPATIFFFTIQPYPIVSYLKPFVSCMHTVLSCANPILSCVIPIRFIAQTFFSILFIVPCILISK